MSRLTYKDLLGNQPIWLLRFSWMGREWYFSTRPVTPLDKDGAGIPHDGQLAAISLDATFDLLSEAPSELTASLEISLGVDVGALIEEGHDLHSATGELSLWVSGITYERRQVMVSGKVDTPTYGAASSPITFALVQKIWDDRSQILSEAAKVTPETWPNFDEAAEDKYYPLILGAPGVYTSAIDSATITYAPATPALYVDTSGEKLLIAAHPVAASVVQIYDASEDPMVNQGFSVSHTTDGLGRVVAIVDISGGSTVTAQAGHKYWVDWRGDGGLTLDGSTALSGAGEWLEYLLARSTIGIDRGRTSAATPLLNGLQIAGYVDEQSSIYEWLQDNLLPLLPISMLRSQEGLYPVIWLPNPPSSSVVEQLQAGEGLFRSSDVTYVGEVLNQMSISYATDGPSNSSLRTVTLGPTTDASMGATYIENVGATVSASRYGIRAASTLSTDLIYGDADALWILSWRMLAHAFPHREIQYDADPLMAWIESGALVSITDPDLSLTDKLAVWSPSWDDLRLIGRLMIYDNPVIF